MLHSIHMMPVLLIGLANSNEYKYLFHVDGIFSSHIKRINVEVHNWLHLVFGKLKS